ncbi:MAG: peptidyl-prolyl cis-trans isomerase [Polyangiaceae bacterium]
MNRPSVVRLMGFFFALSACGHEGPAPSARNVALGGETIARVGDTVIGRRSVEAVASARKLPPTAALDALVDDALFAKWALSEKADRRPDVAWTLRSATARFVIDAVRRDAVARGPATDDEIRELSKDAWRDVDVPESFVVVHAIALRGKEKDAAHVEKIRLVAESLRRAVGSARSAEEFRRLASAVPHDGVKVRVEDLPAMLADGRVLSNEGTMDATFASAAAALRAPGAISDIVETKFGWHVIFLVEKVPAKVMPLEERRSFFHDSVVNYRAKRAIDGLVENARKRTVVEIAPDSDAAMAKPFARPE